MINLNRHVYRCGTNEKPACAASFETDVRQILEDLGLADQTRVH